MAKGRGLLVGILTNRDVRFATDKRQPIAELDDQGTARHVRENVWPMEEAKRLLHQTPDRKALVVDEQYRCVGLITVKDSKKRRAS